MKRPGDQRAGAYQKIAGYPACPERCWIAPMQTMQGGYGESPCNVHLPLRCRASNGKGLESYHLFPEPFVDHRQARLLRRKLHVRPDRGLIIHMAMREGVIEGSKRFSMHGLKHRGITDTAGNRGDKQDAAGHKSPATTGRYDHEIPIVKPPRKR